jgi:PAS domain S-box-containing protein
MVVVPVKAQQVLVDGLEACAPPDDGASCHHRDAGADPSRPFTPRHGHPVTTTMPRRLTRRSVHASIEAMDDGAQTDDARALVEHLRASEARFRAICECAPLGIYVSDIEKGVVYVNPAMQRMLGRTEGELLGDKWRECLHPDDRARTLGERAHHYRDAAPMQINARYLRSDGEVIWTRTHAAPIREGDVLLGYVGMLEDVSEHRALQAQLVMAGRLASVGTLAAGVAHEVNTPIAVALGNLEWTQQRLDALVGWCAERGGGLSATDVIELAQRLEALVRPLQDVREGADRVRLIMKDLSLLARPDARDDEVTSLERVLDSAARIVSHELKHRARLERDYGALPWVRGSESRLGQVFLNLLLNAAQAIPEGAPDEHEVRVQTSIREPGLAMIEVRDTGVGMTPEVRQRVFDPFFTTKSQSAGTGLGLAICHRIVDGLGGRIECETAPSRGSVFRVLLPMATAPEQTTLPPQPIATIRGRVLVIDDDTKLLNSLARLLSETHEVETTTSARAALTRIRLGERYDAVLCDLMMPDMSGMAFHAKLSAHLPDVADRVIFMTGGAVTDEAQDFLDQAPNPRLEKPFDARELKALLARRLDDPAAELA